MDSCIFCKIVKKEIPSREVYRDEEIVAFYDISPKAPVHVLVVPVKHIESLRHIEATDEAVVGRMMSIIKAIAQQLGVAEHGYKVVMNNGPASGQLVYHLHAHLLGGWTQKKEWEV